MKSVKPIFNKKFDNIRGLYCSLIFHEGDSSLNMVRTLLFKVVWDKVHNISWSDIK